MRTLLALSAFGGLIAGTRHFLNFLNQREKNRVQEKRLEIWETEGGAVPAERTTSAGQVKPRKRREASPRDVS